MLCAPTREAVSEWLYRHHDVPTTATKPALLRRAIAANRDEDIEVLRNSVQFGLASCSSMLKIQKRSTSLNRPNPSSAPAG